MLFEKAFQEGVQQQLMHRQFSETERPGNIDNKDCDFPSDLLGRFSLPKMSFSLVQNTKTTGSSLLEDEISFDSAEQKQNRRTFQ